MKPFEKIFGFIAVLLIAITLCMYALPANTNDFGETTQTETLSVKAVIVKTEHSDVWQQRVLLVWKFRMIQHPETNNVTLKYEDITKTFDDKALYDACTSKNGQFIDCELKKIYHDNGSEEFILGYKKDIKLSSTSD